MSVHLITYYMQQSTHHHHHEHDESCCDSTEHNHEHEHEHGENCGCGGDPDFDLVCTIETLGKWAQFTPTGFLVVSELTSEEIIEKLNPTISERDILFVTKVDPTDVACSIPQCKDWIISVCK